MAKDRLRELGYAEGQSIVVESRFGGEARERVPSLAAELVGLKVDVLVAGGTSSIHAAKGATRTVPIVMAQSSDPVASGFVATLSRPGGNITGLSSLTSDLTGKRLELLKEAVPSLSRVGVLWNLGAREKADELKQTQAAAQVLAIQVISLAVRKPEEFGNAFQVASQERVGALMVLGDPLTNVHQTRLMKLASNNRLPTIFAGRGGLPEPEGLLSYGPNYADLYKRAAVFVDKILKGAKPADLPVEQPTKFDLVINLKTAKALGLTIPQSLLLRADQLIE